MSPTRLGYKELGPDLVKPLQDQPCKHRRPPMAKEKKEEVSEHHFKIFLEESLEKQRNITMDNFAHILQWMPTYDASSSNNHSRGTNSFKIHVNFEIPIFEGQIDVDAIDRWLNLLEGYFSVHDFSNQEKIIFALLKATPHVKESWEMYCEKKDEGEASLFSDTPTWN